MFYLFQDGICVALCEDKSKLDSTKSSDKAVIVEHESWLNPSTLYLENGEIKVHQTVLTDLQVKAQKIAAIDAKYQPHFAELAQNLGVATLDGNQVAITGIKEDYATLKAEYTTKMEALA